MSYSQLIVFRDGKAERDEEYRNSHGAAPMVWETLLSKYYECIYPDAPFLAPRIAGINGGWEALRKAVEEHRVPLREWERIVLEFTYDKALVAGADLATLADALDRFEDAFKKPKHVCHLSAIAKRLRELGPCDAVGLHATSVCESPWTVREAKAAYAGQDAEEIEEEWRPYDLARDEKHWFVQMKKSPPASDGAQPEQTGSALVTHPPPATPTLASTEE